MDRPARIVDAHVHLWDPDRSDWYPYLPHLPVHGDGDRSRMCRRFDVAVYREETAAWNVEKIVNVAAATGLNSVEETLHLDDRAAAAGGPDAIIGGLPPTATPGEAVALLDRQMQAARFRGVRPMGGPAVPDRDVLQALAERGLIFELMVHPDQLGEAAGKLEAVEDLTVVVEHTGWPRSAEDEERRLWQEGMRALAQLGPAVHCKLSGLAMPLGSMRYDDQAPWLEYAITVFGPQRCFFASNFPVDAAYGTFDELYDVFTRVASGSDSDELFAANAERLYRL